MKLPAIAAALLLASNACSQTTPPERAPWRVIIAPFQGTMDPAGRAMARTAERAFADELATSRRYQEAPWSDVEDAISKLHTAMPATDADWVKVARAAGVDAVVLGTVEFAHTGHRRKAVSTQVGLGVRVLDADTGDPIDGAAVVGDQAGDLSAPPTEDAAALAGRLAARDVAFYVVIEGIITNSVANGPSDVLLVNRGWRDGLREGMVVDVIRRHQLVGRLRIADVFADDAEGRVIENRSGLRPEDTVRAVFVIPKLPH